MTSVRRPLLAFALALIICAAAAPAHAVEPGVVISQVTGRALDPYDQTQNSGSKWVRLFMEWSTIESQDGSYGGLDSWDREINAYNARGVKVLLVVLNSPSWAAAEKSAPPREPAKYGEFMEDLARRWSGETGGPHVSAFEIWNEPDADQFWKDGPQPAAYTALLKAAYPAIKRGNPHATVVTGGMVGNNFDFLEKLYASGAKGSFDAIGIHTDTACLRTDPDDVTYRELDGRIGRFVFSAYREVREVSLQNQDPKPLWFTEMGWSTSGGNCHVPGRTDHKAGVDRETQALYLKKAYECLQSDDYVHVGLWFSLQDVSDSDLYDHQLGLIDHFGQHKPAFDAFKSFAAAPVARTCGVQVDKVIPEVTLTAPAPGQQYLDTLSVRGTATDDVKVNRMELQVDGKKVVTQSGAKFALDWHGARELSMGRHTLELRAYDAAKNTGRATITIEKTSAGSIRVGKAQLKAKVKRTGKRSLLVQGTVGPAAGSTIKPKGRVRAYVYIKKGKRWKLRSRFGAGAGKGRYKFGIAFRGPGRHKVVIRFDAKKPYKRVALKPKYYKVR